MTAPRRDSLDLCTLAARYAAGATPYEVLADVQQRIAAWPDKAVWIDLLPPDAIVQQLQTLMRRRNEGAVLPLFGIPFAVKDNIDVAGRKTTAACPGFAYQPERTATVVARLCDAGAILVGKTNLDQFATGLVGTRSPYGVCHNSFNPDYISGGSSSGSAVSVAAGLVSFSLGTDTAGSGRVPAAFNNIIGLKPTRGRLSTYGVVPACRSLDCVSIFALTCEDAAAVASIGAAFDPVDIYSRTEAELKPTTTRSFNTGEFRFGVPAPDQLQFFGDDSGPARFFLAVEQLERVGGTAVEIDFSPFAQAARLLYEGPWLAERMAAVKTFYARRADSMLPITRTVIGAAERLSGVDAFEGQYELRRLIRLAAEQWKRMDTLVIPTAGRIYTIHDIEQEPRQLNLHLGFYTNFVNLMDLCALAVPTGFDRNGLPSGISFVAPAGSDDMLLQLGSRLHRATGLPMGATGLPLPAPSPMPATSNPTGVLVAVVGAHLQGQPLNHQMTDRGAALVRACQTAPRYKLVALPGTTPPKPGLIRAGNDEPGTRIDVEVWDMAPEAFGGFVAMIPPPLSIGSIELDDGSWVKSFLCESYAAAGARDISSFGGWRQYLSSL